MDERAEQMNSSIDENGDVSHWHVVFLRDTGGHMTQLLSHPNLIEEDIDKFKVRN